MGKVKRNKKKSAGKSAGHSRRSHRMQVESSEDVVSRTKTSAGPPVYHREDSRGYSERAQLIAAKRGESWSRQGFSTLHILLTSAALVSSYLVVYRKDPRRIWREALRKALFLVQSLRSYMGRRMNFKS